MLTAHAREIVGAGRAVTKVDRDDGEPPVKAIASEGSIAPDGETLTAPLVARDGRTLGTIELVGTKDHPSRPRTRRSSSSSRRWRRSPSTTSGSSTRARARSRSWTRSCSRRRSGLRSWTPSSASSASTRASLRSTACRCTCTWGGARGDSTGVRERRGAARAGARERRAVLGVELDGQDGRKLVASYYPVRARGELLGIGTIVEDVTDAHRAKQRLRLLADAGTVLGSSLDYEQTLAEVSELVVPTHADWCSISVLEDDGSVKVVRGRTATPSAAAGPTRCARAGRSTSTTRRRLPRSSGPVSRC